MITTFLTLQTCRSFPVGHSQAVVLSLMSDNETE